MSRPVALALRALGLGDYLTGLPALRLVRQALPEHQLVLAAGSQLGPLLPLTSYLDELYASGELEPLTGFGRPVDVAIDLHGNGIASRRLLAELAPGRLIGFGWPPDGLTGPVWRPGEHEVARWCRLICETLLPTGSAFPPVAGCVARPRLAETAGDIEHGVTVLHPGAAFPARRWPPQRFVEVARQLVRHGHRVVVTAGPAERGLAETIADRAGAQVRIGPSLTELFALVASARLVLSGDTGIAHVASNYRTPSVTLFGPVSPAAWGPPPDRRHVALFHGEGSGDPHGSQTDPALLLISAEEVLQAVEGVLAVSDELASIE